MAINGFDTDYFVNELFEYAQQEFSEWAEGKTSDDIEELIQNVYPDAETLDDAAEAFYLAYGADWGIAPNEYFDAAEYRLAWAEKQVETNHAFTVEQALEAYDAVVTNNAEAYEHYVEFGAAAGVNPSNGFDESEYIQSWIDGLDADMTVAELRAALAEVGISALDVYVDYPDYQDDYPAIPVTGDELVVVDPPVVDTTGQTFTLTAAADAIPGLIGSPDGDTDTSNDDTIIATDTTLTAGDILNGGDGDDILRVFQEDANGENYAAIEISNIETLDVTADAGDATFDLSGATGIETLQSTNSDNDVTFNQVTEIATLSLNDTTDAPDVTVEYQASVVSGAADAMDVIVEDSTIGALTIGRVGDANGGIETINLSNNDGASTITQLDTDLTTLNVTGAGDISIGYDALTDTMVNYLNTTVRTVEASTFEGDLIIGVGNQVAETVQITVNEGSGDDTLYVMGGQLNVDMGAGDDTVIFAEKDITNEGFRSDDVIGGGDGTDTLQLGEDGTGNFDDVSTTEFNNKTSFEVLDIQAESADVTLSQEFVDSADETLTVHTDLVAPATTTGTAPTALQIAEHDMVTVLDLTQLEQNTALNFTGGEGSDSLVLENAVFTSNLVLDGGESAKNIASIAGDYDTLSVIGNSVKTVLDAPDLANVSNFEGLNLVKTSVTDSNVVFTVELTQDFIEANTESENTTTTSILDNVFQIFTEAIEGASSLSAGDTVNIDISDIVDADGTLADALGDRSIDLTDLLASGADVNFIVDGDVLTAAEEAVFLASLTTDAAFEDVIDSRANPVDIVDEYVMTAVGAGFDTTSGYLIQDGDMATTNDDQLYATAAQLEGSTVELGLGDYDTLYIEDIVEIDNVFATVDSIAGVEELVLQDGSTVEVIGAEGMNITAEAGATFTLTGADTTGTGSDSADTILASVAGSTIVANGGDDTIFTDIGSDTVYGGTGDDDIYVTGGNDSVDAGAGNDEILVNLATGSSHTLTLGDGTGVNDGDLVAIGNVSFADGDTNLVTIADFNVSEDKLTIGTDISSDDIVTALGNLTAVSNGVFYTSQSSEFDVPTVISTGSVVEIDGNSFKYIQVTNTDAVLSHMTDVMNINSDSVAGTAITVIAYNADGNAAIYVALETDGDAVYDELELIGVISNEIGINALDSSNFC